MFEAFRGPAVRASNASLAPPENVGFDSQLVSRRARLPTLRLLPQTKGISPGCCGCHRARRFPTASPCRRRGRRAWARAAWRRCCGWLRWRCSARGAHRERPSGAWRAARVIRSRCSRWRASWPAWCTACCISAKTVWISASRHTRRAGASGAPPVSKPSRIPWAIRPCRESSPSVTHGNNDLSREHQTIYQ